MSGPFEPDTLDEAPGTSRSDLVRRVIASVVIGLLLVGIAVPLWVDQSKKAVDSRVKADLTAVEEAINARAVDDDDLPTLTVTGRTVYLNGDEVATLHDGTTLGELTGLTTTTWCLTASNPDGKHAADPGYRYKVSADKIDTGVC